MEKVALGVFIWNVIVAESQADEDACALQPRKVGMPNHIRLSVGELNPEGPERHLVQHAVKLIKAHGVTSFAPRTPPPSGFSVDWFDTHNVQRVTRCEPVGKFVIGRTDGDGHVAAGNGDHLGMANVIVRSIGEIDTKCLEWLLANLLT